MPRSARPERGAGMCAVLAVSADSPLIGDAQCFAEPGEMCAVQGRFPEHVCQPRPGLSHQYRHGVACKGRRAACRALHALVMIADTTQATASAGHALREKRRERAMLGRDAGSGLCCSTLFCRGGIIYKRFIRVVRGFISYKRNHLQEGLGETGRRPNASAISLRSQGPERNKQRQQRYTACRAARHAS